MAYIQQNSPAPNKIYNFSLRNFAGGLNNASDMLEDNQASDLINMSFVDEVLLEKRKGQKVYDDWNFGEPIVFIDEFKPYESDNVLIRATQSKLYIEEVELTDLSGKPNGLNYNGKYFFADGGSIYCYGLFAQTGDTYTSIVGTAIDDFVLMEVVQPGEYTPLDDSHTKGVLVVDYNDFVVYYQPCKMEIEDTKLGANVVPANVTYLVTHKKMLFVSGSNKDDDAVFISEVENPFYYPVFLSLRLPPTSDRVRGMAVYDDAIIVGREKDMYAIYGSTNRPNIGVELFNMKKLNTHTGIATHSAMTNAHNYLFFLGSDGRFYSISSTRYDDKTMVTSVISRQLDLFKKPINLEKSDLLTAVACMHDDLWYVSIDDVVLVYSYRNKAWVMYNNMFARSFYVIDGELIWGNEGGVTAMFDDNSYLDFDKPYAAFWKSKFFDMDEANTHKYFREFYLVAHTFKNYNSDIGVLFEIDYESVSDRVVVKNQLSIWGKSVWGDRFINKNINESLPFIIGRRGRNIRFVIMNGYDVYDAVENIVDLETVLGRGEGVLVYVEEDGNYYLYTNGGWIIQDDVDLNQRMKIYQVNGDYEFRGKR